MNRIDNLFNTKKERILSIYFTAGYPEIDNTVTIIKELSNAGADILEIGMPFSDSVVDGQTILNSNKIALENGMSLNKLFSQLEGIRDNVKIPLVLMGYLNPVLQYGIENFCKKCKETSIDAVIIPDLPVDEYVNEYKELFESYGLYNILLITPQTSEKRIRLIDSISKGFVYIVSSAATTGGKKDISNEQEKYFEKIKSMNLTNPLMIGFGISDNKTFSKACEYASGAIVGSAFVKALSQKEPLQTIINEFIIKVKS